MQGLNTTPVQAHTALLGVYGLLSLGLVLLVPMGWAKRAARLGGPAGRRTRGKKTRGATC